MKTILSFILSLTFTMGVYGQNFQSQSFINGLSLSCSNVVQPTNLASVSVITTNSVSLQFTNFSGVRNIADGTNFETRNPFVDTDLYPDRYGNWPSPIYVTAVTNILQGLQNANQSVFIRLIGQSGANSGVVFTFVPVMDGVNESTATADRWVVSVTANTTTAVTLVTNVPTYLWPGCKSLRLTRVVNADTDASSRVDILNCSINGFRP